MKKRLLTLIGLAFSCLISAQQSDTLVSNQLIVKFKELALPDIDQIEAVKKFQLPQLDSLNQINGIESVKLGGNKRMKNTFFLRFNTEKKMVDLLDSYEKTGLFEYVEPNYVGRGHGMQFIPDDGFFSRQWSHFNDGTFPLSFAVEDADIDSELAWEITQGDPDLIVAVLDSGLNMDHPELSDRIIGGQNFTTDPSGLNDDHGHGTNVTGIALAAGNNNTGYAGMNWNSKILVCKVLNAGNFGLYGWWGDAIYFAVDAGASVINLSAGGTQSSEFLRDAVNYAFANNVAVVVSTGNDNGTIQYPAQYRNSFAIGSTDSDDSRTEPFFWNPTSGSNYGESLDFVAPGNYIYGLNHLSNTNYESYWGGTSQAAPLVTGLISLLLSVNPDLSVNDIRAILRESSEDMVGGPEDTPGWDEYYGFGRINAYNALTNVRLSTNSSRTWDKIKLYPNPKISGSQLYIKNVDPGVYSVEIYNVLGQRVYFDEISTSRLELSLNLSYLEPGTYFLNLKNKDSDAVESFKLLIE